MKNPIKDKEGSDRVRRGGYWGGNQFFVRSFDRKATDPNGRRRYLGFRLVKNVPKDKK